VRVLGVDDFAFRKGCTYGTILVDLEKRRPIDLLADREAETLARWLREHPPVEVVARDRSPIYAEGIKNGSPNTVQVADRWHLLKNLRESGRRFLMRENKLLPEAARHLNAISRKGDKISWRRRVSLSSRPKNINGENERRCLYQQAVELHQQGLSGRAIARTLNLHRATIRRFLENETYPARMPRALRPSLLDPYIDYLEKRLREDCWNAGQLWREVRALGYPGGTKMVSRLRHCPKEQIAVITFRRKRTGNLPAAASPVG
jgi:transposase